MSRLTHLKLGLAIAGLILWGYGVRTEVDWLRWTGIVFLTASAVLRFWGKRSSRRGHPDAPDDPPDD
jgi:protein-S-isoprenylcysteine O-methyltransferase Ste14